MPYLKRLHECKVQGKMHPEKKMEEGSNRKFSVHVWRMEVTENV
jgi:hypothetical protein